MFKMNALHVRGLVCAGLALLQACGGGGSGGGSGGGGGGGNGGSSASITVSPSSLTFIASGPNAPAPASQTITGTVSGVSSGTLYITVVGSGGAISNISSVRLTSDTTGEATVSVPVPSSLGVGSHTGTITVRACLNDPNCSGANLRGSPATINVTYHVAAVTPSPTSLSYTIDNTPVDADFSQNLTVTTVPAQQWILMARTNWLSFPTSAASGATINVSLRRDVIDGMRNGVYMDAMGLQHATVQGLLVNLPVTLTIRRTQVNHVSPYVTYTGTASDVIIRGEEFSQVTIQGVSFGSTPAQSFTVVSPTEIRATVPASLPAGRHRVQLQTDSTAVRHFAELVVVDAPQFSATTLSFPDTESRLVNALVYDAERAALGVSVWQRFTGATEFIRFASNGNAWQPATTQRMSNNFALALSADGTEWIAGSDKSLVHIDADDLTTVTTTASPLFPSGSQRISEMAVSNDGTVAVFGDVTFNCGASLMLYDPHKRTFTIPQPAFMGCRGNIGASGDGSRLLVTEQFASGFSTDDVLSLDSQAQSTSPTGLHLLTAEPPAMDRTASRIVLRRTQVYDGSYVLLGSLPANDAIVLSPDGTRAHTFERPATLRSYDLTAQLASTSDAYPQLGAAITLPQSPGVEMTTPLYRGDVPVIMTITPDGRTVFIAGSERILVQPIP
jgi:hypothetical protein